MKKKSFTLLTKRTVLPARLRASTAVMWGTFTTRTSLTETMTSVICSRPSVAAAPPGISLVM